MWIEKKEKKVTNIVALHEAPTKNMSKVKFKSEQKEGIQDAPKDPPFVPLPARCSFGKKNRESVKKLKKSLYWKKTLTLIVAQ